MNSSLRALVLASITTACCGQVIAGVVILPPVDFEDLASQVLSPAPQGTPVAVTSFKGFEFSGAFAYHADMVGQDASFGEDAAPKAGSDGVFLANRARSYTPGPSDLTIALGSAYSGQYFSEVSLRQFNVGTATLRWFSGGVEISSNEYSTAQSAAWVESKTYSFSDTDKIDRITFSVKGDPDPLTGQIPNGLFGLDNLKVSLSGSTAVVPEPGSYALVGLALLAAGAASRRRS